VILALMVFLAGGFGVSIIMFAAWLEHKSVMARMIKAFFIVKKWSRSHKWR
jgi:hypothetical protein